MSGHAIEIQGLVKRFGKLTAVDGIDLTIEEGSCVGMLGPNGAGKTTTIEMLEGLQVPTSGSIKVFGKSWDKDETFLKNKIGIQLQATAYQNELTVEESIVFFESFFQRSRGVDEAIAMVQLESKRDSWVQNLSGGQRQRLGLAIALISDPDLLFLDEPTTGLDPQARRSLWDVIELVKKQGKTVLLTTHAMEEAQHLCDRIIILDHGKVVADGTSDALIATLGAAQVIEFTSDPPLPRALLEDLPGMSEILERNGTTRLSVKELHVTLPALLERTRSAGSVLGSLTTRQASLDDFFLHITGRSLREVAE